MKVLVACEFSGIVRDAFIKRGHDAISCDLLPTESPGDHYQGNVMDIIDDGFDLMIAHPPCTYLTCTGNKWFKPEYKDRFPDREERRREAIKFFMGFAEAPIDKICIENPVGIMSTVWRKPDQIIQPFYFGHDEAKSTCLWLKNLPRLLHEKDLFFPGYEHKEPEYVKCRGGKRMAKWYHESVQLPKEERTKLRSKTFPGIATAMAKQWG